MATINVDESTKDDLKKYCSKHEITQGDFVKSALAYFRKSGITPSDPPESVKEEIAKVDKRMSQLIAFQKTFEKTQMLPLVETLLKTEAHIQERFEGIPEGVERIGKILEVMAQQLALLNPHSAAKPIAPPQVQQNKELAALESRYTAIKEEFTRLLDSINLSSGFSPKMICSLSEAQLHSLRDFIKRAEKW